jgi:hypothetical protein
MPASDNFNELYDFGNIEITKNFLIHPDKTKFLFITCNISNPDLNLKLFINTNNVGENDTSKIHSLHRVTTDDKLPAF